MKHRNTQHGFTIIELLIATMIFSVMLLILSYGLIQVTRQYIKSINTGKTQEAARSIVEDISQSIQFGSFAPTPTVTSPVVQTTYIEEATGATVSVNAKYFCVGSTRYTYFEGKVFKKANDPGKNIVLWKDSSPGSCVVANISSSPLPAASDTARELVPNGMELEFLEITEVGTSGLYKITVVVATAAGDSDINGAGETATCKSRSGSQFCAISKLTTYIPKKL